MAEALAPTVADIRGRRSSGGRAERLRMEREKVLFALVFVVFFVLLALGLS